MAAVRLSDNHSLVIMYLLKLKWDHRGHQHVMKMFVAMTLRKSNTRKQLLPPCWSARRRVSFVFREPLSYSVLK